MYNKIDLIISTYNNSNEASPNQKLFLNKNKSIGLQILSILQNKDIVYVPKNEKQECIIDKDEMDTYLYSLKNDQKECIEEILKNTEME